jgi:hypothetical protein
MARVLLTPVVLTNQVIGVGAGLADFVPVAGNATDFNEFVCTGKELLIIQNSGASPYTVTVYAGTDPYGRTGAITAYSLAAGDLVVLGPFPSEIWAQTNGKINVDCSNIAIKYAVLRVP